MIIINRLEKLEEICKVLENEDLIAIDTEFVRRSTYYPKLCLIQIVTKNHELIIDCIPIQNFNPLNTILQNEKILKIFHSGAQDMEIFYRLFNELPKNIFDTQIAANVCGYGRFLSYSLLCEICTGRVIDKTHQASNWLKRPLSTSMLEYAINDVRYLIPIYNHLNNIILSSSLTAELKQNLHNLTDPNNYAINASKIYKKVQYRKRSKDFSVKIRELAYLRETLAMEEDVPRRTFASDQDLFKLALNLPTDEHELKAIRLAKGGKYVLKHKTKLFELCFKLKGITR